MAYLYDLMGESLKDWYKFTIVRNPWDRLVSLYTYWRRMDTKTFADVSFDRFLTHWLDDQRDRFGMTQWEYCSNDDGKFLIDQVYRFENFAEEYPRLMQRIGVEVDIVPHTNQTAREHAHYSHYYTDDLVEFVAKRYAKDCREFKYEFEDRRERKHVARPSKMVHICTVHHEDFRWADIQLRYLRKNLKRDFRIYADTPDGSTYNGSYFYSQHVKTREPWPSRDHATKLDKLTDVVLDVADDDDLIMFFDGDAFPIAPMDDYLDSRLGEYPMLTVCRKESVPYFHPHPSFTCATVRFWKELGSTWQPRYGKSVNHNDTGSQLKDKMERLGVKCYPLLRTNKNNPHPLWFGIYDDLIYHHGAGFRLPISKFEAADAGGVWNDDIIMARPEFKAKQEIRGQMFETIKRDPEFYRQLQVEATS